jgi:hypothetical protein
MIKFRIALSAILGFSILALGVCGQTIDENQFKAAFLFNVAKFVEWPSAAFKSATDPVVCCILGAGPFDQTLEQAAGHQFIDKRKFVFQHVFEISQLSGCHMLYVSSPEWKRWRSLAGKAKGQSILTVGETDDFIQEGGIVRYNIENGKPRIQINANEAAAEKLQISSKLLNLSQIVRVGN